MGQRKFRVQKVSAGAQRCGVGGCGQQAAVLVTDIHEDGTSGAEVAYSESHYGREILAIDRVEIIKDDLSA